VTGYLIRRTIQAIITLLIVSVVSFGMLHLMPGGPVRAMLGTKANPLTIKALTDEMGLNHSLPVQYWTWLDNLLHGNLGFSYVKEQSVSSLIAETLGQSAYLVGLALLVTIVLSIVIGVLQATRRNSVIDYSFTALSFVGYSIPVFFLGVILRYVFQDDLGWIPTGNQIASFHDAFVQPIQMILPVATLVIGSIAGYSRYMRSAILDQITQDYVRTAIAKGAGKNRVLYGHVLRNAMIPMVTLIGLSLPGLVGGALLVEAVFNIQGIGLLTVGGALNTDYVIVLGTTMLTAFVTVLGSLLADICYAALDPRVRLD
jgi:peptide/nickel transport system permease protein